MGKPFETELNQMGETYKWALQADVSKISAVIRTSWSCPLISVGSGGSYSAADFQVLLHRKLFSSIAQAVTPVEMIGALPRDSEAAVWFMSASGNNIDVCRAFQHAALQEIKYIGALVGRSKSKLEILAERHEFTNLFEFPIPSGKDGFLATNSLLAFVIVLYRAYCNASEQSDGLPENIQELLSRSLANFENLDQIRSAAKPLWEKDSLHVIYTPSLKPAAVDIESKFTEAGLISSHLADIRNFAHGRHHWFAKHSNGSGILALSTSESYDITQKTISLLPKKISKVHISYADLNGAESIAGIIVSMYLTSWLGATKGIDPGRPGVPAYGSRIYRLTSNPGFLDSQAKMKVAVARKRKFAPKSYDTASVRVWEDSYKKFFKRISSAKIGGIVLDYDGTLVDSNKRYDPPSKEMTGELIRLLDEGALIGFATGRGKSIRCDLREVIPESYWGRILIGYYNGSEIKPLSDGSNLLTASDSTSPLDSILKQLKDNVFLSTLSELEQRKFQLTVKGKKEKALSERFLWELVQDILYTCKENDGEILRSSHSIDIISKNISKLSVVEAVRNEIESTMAILCIGDKGRWPGNDAKLLNEDLSLSVDEVSSSPNTCWNLCPAGVRGAQGTYYYLAAIKKVNGFLKISL